VLDDILTLLEVDEGVLDLLEGLEMDGFEDDVEVVHFGMATPTYPVLPAGQLTI
jgi:hypothetical protein